MPFHRYVTPTYFGGLPGTHDLINVVSGGIGSGDGSAPVSPQKPGPHINAGTYFVAFGEDASSANANRGFGALAENTDFLDDVIHRDLVVPVLTAAVTPGAPLASVALSGDVFVGLAGEVDDTRTRRQLVQVLTSGGDPLTVLVGSAYQAVQVTAIHDGGPTVIGNEFQTNPTVDFSPSIPAGTPYRLSYYVRTNTKTQPIDANHRIKGEMLGVDSLFANVRTILFGDNTFAGGKIFSDDVEFQGVLTHTGSSVIIGGSLFANGTAEFNDQVDFDADVDFNSTVSAIDTLTFLGNTGRVVFQSPTPTAPPRFTYATSIFSSLFLEVTPQNPGDPVARHYVGYNAGPHIAPTTLFTTNSYRDGGTNLWTPDDDTQESIATDIAHDGLLHVVRTGDMDTGVIAAPWFTSQWLSPATADEAAMYTNIYGHRITSTISSITDKVKWLANYGSQPFYKVEFDVEEIPGQYLYLCEPFNNDTGAVPYPSRVYASGGGTGPGGSTRDTYCITRNASWDRVNGEWVADSTGVANREAMMLGFESARLQAYQKSDTSAPWVDTAWEEILEFNANSGFFGIASDFNYGYLTNKSHTHVVSHSRGTPGHDTSGNSGWEYLGNSGWRSRVDKTGTVGIDQLTFPLNVPSHTDTITVEVLCQPGLPRTGGNRMEARLYRRTNNWATPSVGSNVVEDSTEDNGTDEVQLMTVTASFGADLNSDSSSVWVEILPGNTGATNKDVVWDIRVTFTADRLTNALRG